MNILKKAALIFTICLTALIVEKPVTAFAKLIHSHVQRLQGNWGSSGIMDMPGIPFRTTDNPKYICQWQIYTNEKFVDAQGKEFKKINWAWFEIDKNKTYFKSNEQDWAVAYVFSQPDGQAELLSDEEKIISQTNEVSQVPEMLSHTVSTGFIPVSYNDDKVQYEVRTYISLKQEVNGLVIGGNNHQSVSRDQENFELHARVDIRRASNVRSSEALHPINSQLHCEKQN